LGIEELVTSENYNISDDEDTDDDLQSLLDGIEPGQKKEKSTTDSSSDE
jgi:hypothetical protein